MYVFILTMTVLFTSVIGYGLLFYGGMTLDSNPTFELSLIPAYISLFLGKVLMWPVIIYAYINELLNDTNAVGEVEFIISQTIGYSILIYIFYLLKKKKVKS